MARSGFKMKGSPMARNFGIGASPARVEEVVQGGTLPEVEVSGGKKTTWDDLNAVMTPAELKDAKINPQPGTTYYRHKKTGRMSMATKA
tara:strand:+ start:984 stop:1250 length:267 start_codon:yes stop_codon:yes gene_type:complete